MPGTKVISVANSKGGVGKSVLTSVIANFLHHESDLGVAVIDCDDQQSSLYDLRRIEQAGNIGRDLYPLGKSNPMDFPEAFEAFYKGQYDVLLVDLPGTLSQRGVISTLGYAELVLVPTGLSQTDIHGTMEFLKALEKNVLAPKRKTGDETCVRGVWNKIQPHLKEFKVDRPAYEELIGIEFLNSYVPFSTISFGKNVSTNASYQYSGKQAPVFKAFLNEFLTLIKQLTYEQQH